MKTSRADFPLSDKLGVLVNREGHYRVDYALLCEALGPNKIKEFNNWFGSSTVDKYGIYADDVEAFLEGRRNWD